LHLIFLGKILALKHATSFKQNLGNTIKKNEMTRKFILLILTICSISCKKENSFAELGKPVPNYTFSNILNSTETEMSISDLKGKPIILEFWATWCGSCIPAMKKLDSLQREFKDEIEIITISSENKNLLAKFIKSSNTSLRIVSDTTHSVNFKYKVIPHSIIIDKNGIVRAITSPENINKKVINNLISNNEIDLDIKNDFFIDSNLKVKTIKTVSNSDYRIKLKSFDQEKRGGRRILKDLEGNINGIEIWNSPIPRLYQTLFDVASYHRVVYKDSLSENDFPYDNKNSYNMTIEVSNKYQSEWKKIGINFLHENFDVHAKMGVDTLDCYVLNNIDNIIKESNSVESEYLFMGSILKSKKIKMSHLTEYLENFTGLPVLDKTNLNGEYDIELEWQEVDFKTLHSELKKYGLKLEKSDKKLPVKVMKIYKKK
jgi:thiol-disulfide isomerase/thioredoxin